MTENNNKRRCTRCKVNLSLSDFLQKRWGEYYKQCQLCTEKTRKWAAKYKCPHNRQKSTCKECKGSCVCEHNRIRRQCSLCGNPRIKARCIHKRIKYQCKVCDFQGYLSNIVRNGVQRALKKNIKSKITAEYLGCDFESFKKHIENQFKPDMNWDNYGTLWHIDHIVPLKYKNPTVEETVQRLHYTNTQPLYAIENMRKCNRYIG